jgi:hypothetical protein
MPNPEPSAIRIQRLLQHQPKVVLPQSAPIKSAAPRLLSPPRMGRAIGGSIPDTPLEPFTGPIPGSGGGRADDVPMHVPTGSYVIPADIVSHIGDGNSVNGLSVLKAMFQPHPLGASAGPWGAQANQNIMGKGVAIPTPPQTRQIGMPRYQVGPGAATNVIRPQPQMQGQMGGMQRFGGHVSGGVEATPIMASSGEFVVPPDEVKRRGGGNLNKGHKIFDAWVKSLRNQHVKTLKTLPGPAK